MKERDEYYDRIRKITGDHLFDKTIAVMNAPFIGRAVELLASCGLLGYSFVSFDGGIDPDHGMTKELIKHLEEHNGFEDRWRFSFDTLQGNESLVVSGGDSDVCQAACDKAQELGVPALIGTFFENGISAIALVKPEKPNPFKDFGENLVYPGEEKHFDWLDLSNQLANTAKAILLEGTQWQRRDITSLLDEGKTLMFLAHPQWPWVNRYLDPDDENDSAWFKKMALAENEKLKRIFPPEKKVLIVGLGSLGSIAASYFQLIGCSLIGIDGKEVSIHNPVRQLYSTSDVGESKAFSLMRKFASFAGVYGKEAPNDEVEKYFTSAEEYIGIKTDIPDSKEGSKKFREILEEYAPDLVVLATAHPAEYRMANLCREKNIPHIIGRCYRRAKWFEITVVNGNNGPCFGCLQGHLYKGAPANLTEEELARYERAGDEANTVQSEPATRVDTSRCADIMARFGEEMLYPDEERSSWMRRMLSEERTCLIGGNYAERNAENGEWSYGVTVPGGVSLYGILNFIGSETETEKTCLYCGKTHQVMIRRKKFANE